MTIHVETVNEPQREALRQVAPVAAAAGFYLGGGTALALQLGHRRSADLDWFTSEVLEDPARLAGDLRDAGIPFVTEQIGRGTLHGTVNGVRTTCLEYRYPLLAPAILWAEIGCPLASLDDLACMKLAALAQRGARRDFVDIYALGVAHRPLAEMLDLYRVKYSVSDIGHLLYALVYFEDADRERMPRLLWNADWLTVKTTIQTWVKEIAG